jgi:O-antigen/teichoic acid export membrane protein
VITLSQVRADPLVRNSFFLMATSALGAVAGFGFWIIVARLYPPVQVGKATSLLSVVALLSYFSQFGLATSLVRYLPTAANRDEHVGTAITTVTVTGVVIAAGFAVLIPVTNPELSFVASSIAVVAIFAVLAMFAAQNLLINSVFVAMRDAKYNLLLNGVLMSAAKLILPAVLVWAGAMGIFMSSTAASAVATAASIYAIHRYLGIRVRPTISLSVLRTTMRYSLGSYVSSCLNLAPLMVVPLYVLHHLGAVEAAAYFIAFQIANLIYAVSYAVGEALFAEGAYGQESLWQLAKRSGLLILAITAPVVGGTVLASHVILSFFGHTYAADAQGTLVVLAVSAFAVAFNTWSSFLLKVTRQLFSMIVSNFAYAVAIIGPVLIGGHGLIWIAWMWGLGNLVSGIVAVVALVARRKKSTAVAVAVAAEPLYPAFSGVLLEESR